MKTFSKGLLASAVLAASAMTTTVAHAELSANVGFLSDYYFRGVDQEGSATGTAGIDYESAGFYAGAWVADVADGLEIDGYFGYGFEVGEVSLGLGFTTYQYTGDFDTEYNEVNFTAGFGPISLEYTVGERDEEVGPNSDYDFAALTYENNGFYGTYGSFSDDADGDYLELGYGGEIGGFDAGIAFIFNDEDLSNTGENDESLVFSIGKTFDL